MNRFADTARKPNLEIVESRPGPVPHSTAIHRQLPTVPSELDALAHRLFLSSDDERPVRSVVFAGATAEEDGSRVCGGTAIALAQQTTSTVCLVDASLNASPLPSWLGVTNHVGLGDALVADLKVTSCVIQLRPNLWFLPPGPRADEARAQLAALEIRARLQELRATFDYVLIHATDIGPQGDLFALAPAADGVVLVVDAAATRRESARRMVDELRAVRIAVLGAVLTNRGFPIPAPLYRRL